MTSPIKGLCSTSITSPSIQSAWSVSCGLTFILSPIFGSICFIFFISRCKDTNKWAKYQINLSIFERKYLLAKRKDSANRTKNQIFFLFFWGAAYFLLRRKIVQNFDLAKGMRINFHSWAWESWLNRVKKQIFPHFFILLPPTQGDKRGSRTKKRKPRDDFRFLFYSLNLTRGRVSLFGKLFLFVIMKSCPKREKSCKEKGNTVYYTWFKSSSLRR